MTEYEIAQLEKMKREYQRISLELHSLRERLRASLTSAYLNGILLGLVLAFIAWCLANAGVN